MNYPNLTRMLNLLALDNDIPLKPAHLWLWPADSPLLEAKANSLTDEEAEILVVGEVAEAVSVVRRKGVGDLDYFLAEAFDGTLSGNFFRE